MATIQHPGRMGNHGKSSMATNILNVISMLGTLDTAHMQLPNFKPPAVKQGSLGSYQVRHWSLLDSCYPPVRHAAYCGHDHQALAESKNITFQLAPSTDAGQPP